MKNLALKEVFEEQAVFRDRFQTLILSTVDPNGRPEASYAPFVRDNEGNLFVYVSELSRHTQNLMASNQASALFIQSEEEASHIFARQRLTYECASEEIERESTRWHTILDMFENKFGKFIEMLRNLEDFHLFIIQPQRAGYVRGFAQAYEITGEKMDQIRHINDAGHKAQNKATKENMDKQLETS